MQNSMFGNILPPQMMNNLKGMAAQAIGGMKQMGQMATEAETVMALISAYRSGNLMPVMQQMAQQLLLHTVLGLDPQDVLYPYLGDVQCKIGEDKQRHDAHRHVERTADVARRNVDGTLHPPH